MKTTAIIGIVLSGLTFLCLCAFVESDPDAAIGWGFIADIYLLVFSIVVLALHNKKQN